MVTVSVLSTGVRSFCVLVSVSDLNKSSGFGRTLTGPHQIFVLLQNLSTKNNTALSTGSQHCQAVLSLVEIVAKGQKFCCVVVHRCNGALEGNQMISTLLCNYGTSIMSNVSILGVVSLWSKETKGRSSEETPFTL